jgi:hypothetical protein
MIPADLNRWIREINQWLTLFQKTRKSLFESTWRARALHRADQPEVGRKCCTSSWRQRARLISSNYVLSGIIAASKLYCMMSSICEVARQLFSYMEAVWIMLVIEPNPVPLCSAAQARPLWHWQVLSFIITVNGVHLSFSSAVNNHIARIKSDYSFQSDTSHTVH